MDLFFIERPKLASIQKKNPDDHGILLHLDSGADVYVFCFADQNQLQVMINQSLITLNDGQVLFGPAAKHLLKLFGTNSVCYVLQIACPELKALLDQRIPHGSAGPPFTSFDLTDEISLLQSMCEQLLRESQTGKNSQAVISSILECIVVLFARAIGTADSDEDSFVRRTQSYIREHYREDLTLSQLASHVNVSVYHLSHIFKEKTGIPPMKYVINCRMEQAQKLLSGSNESISAIAMEVGYDSSNYFSMLFKKTVGLSPLQYRRKHRK